MSDRRLPGPPPTSRPTDTPEVAKARRVLAAHVTGEGPRDRTPTPAGVVRVIGRAGLGKTHLLHRVEEACREWPGDRDAEAPTVVPVLVAARGCRVDDLYVPFVAALTRECVTAAVRHHYADSVTDLLADEQVARVAGRVLRSADLGVSEQAGYVARLGVPEPLAIERLRDRLEVLIGDADHAVACTMLVREGLADAAWAWLCGGPPSPALEERGLERTAGGVNGIGALARLFSHPGFRLTVLLDDVDRLVGGRSAERGLEALLDALSSAGALVFATRRSDAGAPTGSPGPRDQRLELAGLGSSIGRALFRDLSAGNSLAPFETSAVQRIVDLAEGNPRVITDLRARLSTTAPRTTVTEDDVVAEARVYFATIEREKAVAAVRRVLDVNGWPFRHSVPVAFPPHRVNVDFWVSADGRGNLVDGCWIVVVDVVLSEEDVEYIASVERAVHAQARLGPILLVVVGPVSSRYGSALQDIVGRPPLTFVADTFADDLTVAVKGMLISVASAGSNDYFADISRRLDAVDETQTRMLRLLEGVVASTPRRGSPVASGSALVESDRPRDLPERVEQVFDLVTAGLDELGTPASEFAGLFGPASARAAANLRRLAMRQGRQLEWGAIDVVRAVVTEFENAVRAWFRARFPGSDRSDNALGQLCATYDEHLAELPLDRLADATGALGPGHQVQELVRRIQELGSDVRRGMASEG